MASRGDDPAPLLPASLKGRLQGWLWKLLGSFLLAACAVVSASLLTWSITDPSLSRATGGTARNLLGAPGAILSDLTMQTLGLAGVIVLLPPLFWALQLLSGGRPPSLRGKLVLAASAVLFVAGALSSLPRLSAWPLHHGYGGLLGDLGLGLLTSLLASVNPDRSGAAAGLFCFAAGVMSLMWSLGLTQGDLKLICRTNARPRLDVMAGWLRRLQARAWRPRPPAPIGPDPALIREPPMLHVKHSSAEEAHVPEASDYDSEVPDSGRGPAFDQMTDQQTCAIARRFKPERALAIEPVAERREPELPGPPAFGDDAQPRSDAAPVPQPRRGATSYQRPPLSLLKRPPASISAVGPTPAELRGQAQLLTSVLGDFGVRGEVKSICPGPVITLFEFEPARGVKSARVIGLADDISRSLGTASVRAAVVPGRNAIGIELPNARREKVNLRQLLESEAFRASDACLPLMLGRDITGAAVVADLARMPHLLVAGTTGAGKSVGINAMILSLLYRLSPEQCRFLLIDPKMLELSAYNGVPHLLCPVVTDPDRAVAALDWLIAEMEQRYRQMSWLAARNIDVFNSRVRQLPTPDAGAQKSNLGAMPHIVVIVDEFADLMSVAGKEIEAAVQRLAQMARAAGIHLIMATQRPSVDIVTGTIKANFPARISYKVASKFDSRTILNEHGAEQLLGQGDMLFANGTGRALRVHGSLVSDDEVEAVAGYLRGQGEPRYVAGITATAQDGEPGNVPRRPPVPEDDLYQRAVAIVRRDRKASTSYLQRRLLVGYNRAAQLMERMEREGIVSAPGHRSQRQVLLDSPGNAEGRW